MNFLFRRHTDERRSPCACGRSPVRQRHVMIIDPTTLRRRRFYICGRQECYDRVRATSAHPIKRTLHDWMVEHPEPLRVEAGIKPQYPSRARRTLRAFMDSGLEAATVDGDPSTLNLSAGTLGLTNVYAEQRSGTTALRLQRNGRRTA